MLKKQLFVSVILAMSVLLPAAASFAIENQEAQAFVGQDLYLSGNSAVVWLESITTEFRGRVHTEVKLRAYLQDNITVKKGQGTKTTDLSETVVEEGQVMVVQFSVTGEVFVTADKREIADPRGLELYRKALATAVPAKPKFVVQPEARVPELAKEEIRPEMAPKEEVPAPPKREVRLPPEKPRKPGLIERIFKPEKKPVKPAEEVVAKPKVKEPRFVYPVNISPAGEVEPKIESTQMADGTDIMTVIGRLYIWQKQDERGGLLELLADNTVIFYSRQQLEAMEEEAEAEDILGRGPVKAVYMSGDVVMTEGRRTIRADEIYYNFQEKKALAINAVMRNYDVDRGIPIYVRAAKLRQLAENKFAAENITLTTSEFYLPQISVNASSAIITDTTTIDEQMGKLSDSSYDAELRDIRLKVRDKTIFHWPFMRSNLQRPDIPLKSIHVSRDNTFGTSFETRWHLSRLLGLREPEGTESTLALDYYEKRGVGIGAEIDYVRENYFGQLLGYVIRDSGEDRLSRSRKNLEPPRELRGRFYWRHKHFLPYNWQLTAGVAYASDEHFIEGYYRSEFNVGVAQETYIHLKRIEDNWGLSILGKGRINDFADELEELPSVEYHLTGQSLFDDRFTLYNDTQVSRLRQTISDNHPKAISQEQYAFVSHRIELDMPINYAPFKIVPFVAGTFGYDDRSGFTRSLVDGTGTGSFGEDEVWFGEAGVRASAQYWKVYPNVKSKLWDLNQLRHIIKPQLTAVLYEESDSVVEQRNTLNFAVSQRLQTKRGGTRDRNKGAPGQPSPGDKQRTVDWMRLDMDVTWVEDSEDAGTSGPDRFIWNRPIVPLRVLSTPQIFNGDLDSELQRFEMYGPRRNYFGADYVWRLSDTTAVLSDMNFDMQSGVVQQFNIGFSHLRWPNLSYYIGSRYLRRTDILGEKGTNAFTFAVTYTIDPRYTLILAQQYDFDYGANIQSDITLIRRYHRVYCGLTYSADESMDRQAIVLSIWPQGIPELAIGPTRYLGLGTSADY
ncbi:MAG: LPS-assembly protein LptD [Planctomycetota bacterium]|jgi:hypothetical protein